MFQLFRCVFDGQRAQTKKPQKILDTSQDSACGGYGHPPAGLVPAGALAGETAAAAEMHGTAFKLCIQTGLRVNGVLAGQRQIPIELHGRPPARREQSARAALLLNSFKPRGTPSTDAIMHSVLAINPGHRQFRSVAKGAAGKAKSFCGKLRNSHNSVLNQSETNHTLNTKSLCHSTPLGLRDWRRPCSGPRCRSRRSGAGGTASFPRDACRLLRDANLFPGKKPIPQDCVGSGTVLAMASPPAHTGPGDDDRTGRRLGEEEKRGRGAGRLAVPRGAGALQAEVGITINTIMVLY